MSLFLSMLHGIRAMKKVPQKGFHALATTTRLVTGRNIRQRLPFVAQSSRLTTAAAFWAPPSRIRRYPSSLCTNWFVPTVFPTFHRLCPSPNKICFLSTASKSTEEKETVTEGVVEEELQEIYQELKWLSSEIRRHDALYYNSNNNNNNDNEDIQTNIGMIADDDYDALVRREEDICRMYPELQFQWEQESGLGKDATRVGGRVGIGIHGDDIPETTISTSATTTATSRFQKRSHLTPMLSLDNITTKDQLEAWLERLRKKLLSQATTTVNNDNTIVHPPPPVTLITEPKLDGLSLSLRYKLLDDQIPTTYKLVWACTRGDGKKGQDVTVPVVEGMKLPPCLIVASDNDNINGNVKEQLPAVLEIRGEVVMPKSVFQELKQASEKAQEDAVASADNNQTTTPPLQRFSNARNAASGILLRKEDVESSTGSSGNQTNSSASSTNATNTTRSLQSKLRFYAYDIAVSNRNTEDNKLEHDPQPRQQIGWLEDALSSRQQLEAWGFHVPSPVAVTELGWRLQVGNSTVEAVNDGDDSDGSGNSNDASILYEPWTDKDMLPMIDYHDAFGRHRDQQAAMAGAGKKPSSKAETEPVDYKWGDYDMDGCVHKVSHQALRRLIGNSNRAPRWAVAHKFPAQSAITTLVGIEIQVGRKTGALTPVAILEPVELAGGVIVTRATLHNFQHMQQMFLGRSNDSRHQVESDGDKLITSNETLGNDNQRNLFLASGSKVLVRRAGEVIPQVVQLAEPPKLATASDNTSSASWIDLSVPETCPACGSPTVSDLSSGTRKSDNKTDVAGLAIESMQRGQVLRCGGPQLLCPPRAVGALVHAFSRDALDISGLSEARIQQLSMVNNTKPDGESYDTLPSTNASLIKLQFPSDIFRITKDEEALEAIASLPGWGSKSVQNLANTANKVASDGVSLSRFIYSLGIRYAGIHSSKILASAYGSVGAFLHDVEEASQTRPGRPSADDDIVEHKQPFAILANKKNDANKGIGPSLLKSLTEFSHELELVLAAKELSSVVKVLDDEDFKKHESMESSNSDADENQMTKPFNGMTVVFTGSLGRNSLTRKDAQTLAKSMGAKSTPGTISKTTDVVVVGDKGGGKKLETAKQLSIRIMDLDEFMELARGYQQEKKGR